MVSIYDNLPDELAVLRRRKRRELARQATQMAWAAFRRGDAAETRRLARQVVGYRPLSILDRGLLQLIFGRAQAKHS
jgi:hypothetical protein